MSKNIDKKTIDKLVKLYSLQPLTHVQLHKAFCVSTVWKLIQLNIIEPIKLNNKTRYFINSYNIKSRNIRRDYLCGSSM